MGLCLSTHYEQCHEGNVKYKVKCFGLIPMMIIDTESHDLKSGSQHIIRN